MDDQVGPRSEALRARVEAARLAACKIAEARGLEVNRAEVLQDSNRIVVHLLPCESVARVVGGLEETGLAQELLIADRLAALGAPIAVPDSRMDARVFADDQFAMSFWRYYEPVEPRAIAEPAYAAALESLHSAMSQVDIEVPHFTERVAKAEDLASNPERTPALSSSDREFLVAELRSAVTAVASSGAPEQLLHGEPHSDNVLRTGDGLLFTDFETCCRGPVEFDVADVPERVADFYQGLDADLLKRCRGLVLAMVATWCWAGFDEHENLRRAAPALLNELRAAANA